MTTQQEHELKLKAMDAAVALVSSGLRTPDNLIYEYYIIANVLKMGFDDLSQWCQKNYQTETSKHGRRTEPPHSPVVPKDMAHAQEPEPILQGSEQPADKCLYCAGQPDHARRSKSERNCEHSQLPSRSHLNGVVPDHQG